MHWLWHIHGPCLWGGNRGDSCGRQQRHNHAGRGLTFPCVWLTRRQNLDACLFQAQSHLLFCKKVWGCSWTPTAVCVCVCYVLSRVGCMHTSHSLLWHHPLERKQAAVAQKPVHACERAWQRFHVDHGERAACLPRPYRTSRWGVPARTRAIDTRRLKTTCFWVRPQKSSATYVSGKARLWHPAVSF